MKAMKRGALKAKATPVARTDVGNSSGSHTGIHEYWPSVKKPFTAASGATAGIGFASDLPLRTSSEPLPEIYCVRLCCRIAYNASRKHA